jgi:glycosyltransferase involved in cell wall biosynthesis
VLFLSHLYPSAVFPGAGPFVRDEVIALSGRNRVAVVSPLRVGLATRRAIRRAGPLPYAAVEDGISILRPRIPGVPLGGPALESRLWAARLGPILERAYAEIDGELLHAHFALPDGYAAAQLARRRRLPFVLTVWGSDLLRYGTRASLRPLVRRTLAQARGVIAVSDELAERAAALGAGAETIRVIPGGVAYPTPLARSDARAQLGLAADLLCIVWVGGLVPVKQPLQALEAFRLLLSRLDREALLVLVGDGPLREELRRAVQRSKLELQVRLTGQLPRELVWSWQCAADVLVNSSRSEGTPVALLEALGAGTPVVGYAVGGIGAALEAVDGGRLAAARTPEALAEAIAEELATPRDRAHLALEARRRFGVATTASAIERLYDAALA